MNYALIIAGGSGNRMGQDIPKQFMHVNNCPIIIHTLQAFQQHPDIHGIAVVCLAGWETVVQSYANQFSIDKQIFDQEKYDELVAIRTKQDPEFKKDSHFFPLYRA